VAFGATKGPPVHDTEVEESLTLPSFGELATADPPCVRAAPARAPAETMPRRRRNDRDERAWARIGDSSRKGAGGAADDTANDVPRMRSRNLRCGRRDLTGGRVSG
jgi:hypothetical protein